MSQYDLEPDSVEIFINEIMADNDATIEDPDEPGAFEDWIELYNPGEASVDLTGFYLSDDVDDPTQWRFPSGSTIDAGGYLIIWADDDVDQGDDHASFKLSAGGESVLLYNTDGTTLVDSIAFGEQATDVSYGRFPDGSSTLMELSATTPGEANVNENMPVNFAPVAELGGPYAGFVGDTIALSGAASTDSDGTIVTFAWDLDDDGQYDDAGRVTVSYSALVAGTFTVGLQVTDDSGATDSSIITLTVSEATTPGLIVTQTNDFTIVGESGLTDTIDVSLASQPTADVTVEVVSGDPAEAVISMTRLTFTPGNWNSPQSITLSSVDDGEADGTQISVVSFSVTSDDAAYELLQNVEVDVTTQDAFTPSCPTRIYAPEQFVRLHVIPGDSTPTAILFQAIVDTEVSVLPFGPSDAGQTIRMVNESVVEVGDSSQGFVTASVSAGQMYALLFEPHSEDQVYSVRSTFGFDAFIPFSTTNFLQPTDTNGASRTSALDALLVINQLNDDQTASGEPLPTVLMLDVNQDGNTTALDALLVINKLNARTPTTASGEPVALTDQQSISAVGYLSSESSALTDPDLDEAVEPMEMESVNSESMSSFTDSSLQTRSNAIAEIVEEDRSTVPDVNLELLAADWLQFLDAEELLSGTP